MLGRDDGDGEGDERWGRRTRWFEVDRDEGVDVCVKQQEWRQSFPSPGGPLIG